ncbi:MAG TPA: helix-turn-helix transcriptional regulator [Vicinamibacteria bacterium]|nr:helix-turn-helix transcriptional regulator [Vicinamibacteria bacterium]
MAHRDSLGEFEHGVLLAILRLGGEAYSVPIVLELEERTGREVAPAAVYIALRRLEKKGFLASRMSSAGKGDRSRRYFKLRAAALERLRESRLSFHRLWDGIEPLLERK